MLLNPFPRYEQDLKYGQFHYGYISRVRVLKIFVKEFYISTCQRKKRKIGTTIIVLHENKFRLKCLCPSQNSSSWKATLFQRFKTPQTTPCSQTPVGIFIITGEGKVFFEKQTFFSWSLSFVKAMPAAPPTMMICT